VVKKSFQECAGLRTLFEHLFVNLLFNIHTSLHFLNRPEFSEGMPNWPKAMVLGALIAVGLALTALSFLDGFPRTLLAWGLLCLGAAGFWMYWDAKKRELTPDEEKEQLLVAVIKRLRATGSQRMVLDEFRAKGASSSILNFVEDAPRRLRRRAETKMSTGRFLMTGSFGLGGFSYFVLGSHELANMEAVIVPFVTGVGLCLSAALNFRLLKKLNLDA
jgi:uncharacterized membrane protein YfcA